MNTTSKEKTMSKLLIAMLLMVAPVWAGDTAPAAKEGGKAGESRTFAPELELVMQWCPPGTFMMGSPETETDRSRNEVLHEVTMTKGFWMGKTEVTQAQWEAVMGMNLSHFKGANLPAEPTGWKTSSQPKLPRDLTLPAESMDWYAAKEFCRQLTQRERKAGRLPDGFAYRLPTEAEWEYACRAGTKEAYAGDLDAMAWYEKNSDQQTHPVAKKQANAWGLHDMHGNVWEYCADGYAAYPAGAAVDPIGPTKDACPVYRGGCWSAPAPGCRSAIRRYDMAGTRRSNTTGFRVVLSIQK